MSDIIAEIKSSCLASLDYSGIKIDEAGIREFWTNVSEQDWNKFCLEHGAKFPLKYSSPMDELNFLSILTILNFLSAYRIPLHEKTGKGAYDTIRRFIMTCYLGQMSDAASSPLTAAGMAKLSEHATAEFLGVPLMTEKDHPSLPVKIGERDAMAAEIVGLVQNVMNETGEILQAQKKVDLGHWVADVLNDLADETPEQRASALVRQLATTFPAFADQGKVKGLPVKVMKKAQLLTYLIGIEFNGRDDLPFPLPSTKTVTATVDNVVPTMAVHFKMLDLSDCKFPVYSKGLGEPVQGKKVQGITQTAEEAYAIRAAAVAAVERAVALTGEVADKTGKDWLRRITSMDLDGYLWSKAKDGALRDLPRLSEPGTIMY